MRLLDFRLFAGGVAGTQSLLRGCLTGCAGLAYGDRMPSPIGHALGGALAAVLLEPAGGRRAPDGGVVASGGPAWSVLALAMAAGCAPDLDFLWGRHSMETHSLGAALAAGLVAWAISRRWRTGLVVAVAWTTHVAFDWLGSDDTPPIGVMALWPLTSAFYFADAFVFEAISRRYWLPGFWGHNLWAVCSEALMLGPLTAAAVWWRGRTPRARG